MRYHQPSTLPGMQRVLNSENRKEETLSLNRVKIRGALAKVIRHSIYCTSPFFAPGSFGNDEPARDRGRNCPLSYLVFFPS